MVAPQFAGRMGSSRADVAADVAKRNDTLHTNLLGYLLGDTGAVSNATDSGHCVWIFYKGPDTRHTIPNFCICGIGSLATF